VKRFADVLQQTPIEQETAPATGPIRARTLGDRGHSDCAKYGWPIPEQRSHRAPNAQTCQERPEWDTPWRRR